MATLTLSQWQTGIRPKTLVAIIAPISMAGAVAFKKGVFDPLFFTLTLLAGLFLQASTNLINDYYDGILGRDTKERKGPLRLVVSGQVSPDLVKKTAFSHLLAFILLMVPLMIKGGEFVGILTAISALLAIAYSKGKKSLSTLGLGELFVFPFFGPIAFFGTYYLQSGALDLSLWPLPLAAGALSTAMIAIANLRDVEEDKKSGKKTLATRFGAFFGAALVRILILTSAIATLVAGIIGVAFLPLAITLTAMLLLRVISLPDLAVFGKTFWLYTLFFTWALLH